jgi:GDPmannose 4,6-dehydratase
MPKLHLHLRPQGEMAFSHVGLDYQDYLRIDEIFYRPAEVHLLKGDYSKGGKILSWGPRVSFRELIQMMVDADLEALKHNRFSKTY